MAREKKTGIQMGKRMGIASGRAVLFALIAALAAAAAVFGWTDLRISEAVYDPHEAWVHFFERYGEHPAYILVFIGAQVLVAGANAHRGWRRGATIAVAAILTLASGYRLASMTVSRVWEAEMSAMAASWTVIITLAAAAVAQLALRRINPQSLASLQTVAWLTVGVVLGEIIVVSLLKIVWGRVRFRDLLPDRSNYTAWFWPQGGGGHRSFPSQHAANGWMLLLAAYWLPVRAAGGRAAIWLAAAVWGAATAVSRVVAGAHYASDVLFGSVIAIAVVWLAARYTLRAAPADALRERERRRLRA